MRPGVIRPFRIRDSLILVTATGLGLATGRSQLSAVLNNWTNFRRAGPASVLYKLWFMGILSIPPLSILLIWWTAAILLLQLCDSQPPRRRLWYRPGFLACVAVVFGFAWKVICLGTVEGSHLLINRSSGSLASSYANVIRELSRMPTNPGRDVGAAIFLLWVTAWASGRWQPEPSWIDRGGQLLGTIWVCVSLLAVSIRME
ncbi:hypothetical protein ACYOEI_22235 [Singulisphaera rosea]